MDALIELSWRLYPASALIALGVVIAAAGARRCRLAFLRPLAGSMYPLGWMHGFRLTVIGLAVVGIGAAWLWHLGWLLALSLAIGGEETLESSIAIAALRRARPDARVPRRRDVRLTPNTAT